MTPQQLRSSILQLAIQGRLVEQRPEEGTGAELLREIFAAKNAKNAKGNLTRSRGVRGEKNTSALSAPPREEIPDPPFEIPESWVWVHWGDVVNIVSARRVHQSDWKKEGVPFYRAREIAKLSADGYVDNDLFISQELYDAFSKSGVPKEGDLMVTAVGTLGKTYIVKDTDHFYYKDASVICLENYARLSPQYLKYLMETELMKNQIKGNSSGTTVATLTMVRMEKYLLPLPPLAEQKRIVAKIEELLPLVDRYEKAWSRLEEFNRRFPEDMRKSLLQMAIQGKLVEQRPEEGTGAELLCEILAAKGGTRSRASALMTGGTGATSGTGVRNSRSARRNARPAGPASPAGPTPVSPEDPPFEIPESWVWVRLGEVADVQLGKMLDKGKNKGTPHPYLANLSVRWGTFDLSELRMMPFTEDECRKFALLPGDILMCEGGVPGRCAVWREENSPIKYQKAVHRIRSKVLFPDYTQRFFEAICDSAEFADLFTGTTIKHLPREKLITIPIPLPPLAEQKRIVVKLEEILPLCERLKAKSDELSNP